jgi:ABC-2 type transport system permease protein
MNNESNDSPSDAAAESPLESPAEAPAALSATRPLYWSVRRELWENRSLHIAPLVAAIVALFGLTIHVMVQVDRMRAVPALDPAQQRIVLATPYSVAAILVMVATLIVGAFYCLEALHGERRDRSILFWKSLPVSDLTTVLSKAAVPLVVLPLQALVIILATQLLLLVVSTAVLLVNGISPVTLWTRLPLFTMSLVMLYGLTVHALWHAPIYGWLLLVSAWARRATFLWAVFPPLAIVALERMAFGTSHFGSLLGYRIGGAMREAFAVQGDHVILRLAQLDPVRFLTSPGLSTGLLMAAAFLAAAVRLRRHGEPI